MAKLESSLGEITRPDRHFRGKLDGAFAPTRTASKVRIAAHPRPTKEPCCKECDGRGCVGNCRFD